MHSHSFLHAPDRKIRGGAGCSWLFGLLAAVCLGWPANAHAQQSANAPPAQPHEDAGATKRHGGPGHPPGIAPPPEAGGARPHISPPLPLWMQHYRRLVDVTREQTQLGMQQKTIQSRLAQTEGIGRGAGRERLAARLHELDAREREVRKLKRNLLSDIVHQADAIQKAVEESQSQILLNETMELEPNRLEALRKDKADLQRFQRLMKMILQDPERFLDYTPEAPEAPEAPALPDVLSPPPVSVNPPPQLHMQIRRIEEQIRFLQEKLMRLEMEVDELKSFLDSDAFPRQTQRFRPPDLGIAPVERELGRNPQRRLPGPRRDMAPPAERDAPLSEPEDVSAPQISPPSSDAPKVTNP